MTLKEKSLYHQIHPLKLATDIGCEPLSLYFFWRHDLVLGLVTHFVPPIAASVVLILFEDFEAIKRSRAGIVFIACPSEIKKGGLSAGICYLRTFTNASAPRTHFERRSVISA